MSSETQLCSICQVHPPKYTCPSCKIKTCSFECVKRHKKQLECSGLADQTRFIPKKEIGTDKAHIDRDYNFLLKINRRIQLGKEDIKDNARVVFKRPNRRSDQRRDKRFKPGIESTANNHSLELIGKQFPEGTVSSFKRENTLVVHAPPGMVRSTSNKSGYDKKSGSFAWTVEWVVLDVSGAEVTRFLSYKVKESTSLVDALPYNVINKQDVPTFQKENVKFYLECIIKNEKNKILIALDNQSTLSSCLKDKIVLEYPSIYVTAKYGSLKDYIIRESNPYEIKKSENSDSSDDSTSDDTTTDTDSDSDSDSESDSDSDSSEASKSSEKSVKRLQHDGELPEPETIVKQDPTVGTEVIDSNNEDSGPEELPSKLPDELGPE